MTGPFYPSTVCHLTIRFDEALIQGAAAPKVVSTDEAATTPARRPVAPGEKPALATAASIPQSDGQTVFVLNIVPEKCTIEKSGIRAAGTFNLSLAFRDLPLDPRTIRALGVEIHMGTVDASEFARGQRGIRRPDGTLASVLRTREPGGAPRPGTLVMLGIADEIEEEYGETGLTLRITGRDQRGVLMSSPLPPEALNKLDYSRGIHQIIEELLERHPLSERLTVRCNAAEWPRGRIPEALPPDILPRHRTPARGRGRRATAPHPPGGGQHGTELTFWDAITRLCTLVGAAPTLVNTELWIRPIRGLFEQLQAGPDGTLRTPFYPDAPRDVGGQQIVARRMVVGSNLSRLTFKRKIGGVAKPKTIRCVAVDLESTDRTQNRVVEGRWPPEQPPPPVAAATNAAFSGLLVSRTEAAHRRAGIGSGPSAQYQRELAAAQTARARGGRRGHTATAGGQTAHEDIVNVAIHGVRSKERLTEIARGLFEEIGRNEIEGSYETMDPTSYAGSNDDPDLLRANPGDVLELVTATGTSRAGDARDTLTAHYMAPFEEQVQAIVARLGPGTEQFARAIASTARGRVSPIQRYFRLSSLRLDWTGDKGIAVACDIQNYYVVPNNPEATETQKADGQGTRLTVKGR